jgi:hypothetical protein
MAAPMRMLDPHAKKEVHDLQLYLTTAEATQLRSELDTLLQDPESNEHFHLPSVDGGRDLSCSIVTKTKLASKGYTPFERKILTS